MDQRDAIANPNGRPPGILDKRSRVTKALMDDAPLLPAWSLTAPRKGTCRRQRWFSRCAPVLKAQTEPVQFEFDATVPIAQQIEAVLAGIAGGAVPPDVGKQIIEAIGTLASVRATEELEQRMVMLEARQV